MFRLKYPVEKTDKVLEDNHRKDLLERGQGSPCLGDKTRRKNRIRSWRSEVYQEAGIFIFGLSVFKGSKQCGMESACCFRQAFLTAMQSMEMNKTTDRETS